MGASLNQPSRVGEDGPMDCKPLLSGSKARYEYREGEYPKKKHRLTPCQQLRLYGGCVLYPDLLGLKGA